MPIKKTKRAPRLKNFMTELSEEEIFALIRKSLAEHGAARISFDYEESQAVALSFQMKLYGQTQTFRMPVRLAALSRLVAQSYREVGRAISGERLQDQAYRTGWANIKDWVLSQMALVEAEMVQMQEVFLPYLLVAADKTLFEEFAEQRALPAPRRVVITEE